VRVTVRLFSHFARWSPAGAAVRGDPLDLPDGATVRTALAGLGIPTHVPRVVTVNDTNTGEERALRDGDLLKVFPVAMGG
jgi:sulfur carrier protein ThiS